MTINGIKLTVLFVELARNDCYNELWLFRPLPGKNNQKINGV